ncbi:site-specific integrase [uncultured Alistipes sp.]|jgi:integrase|uniref:site-specific integrase n=1 Tax=uncultured Alistipes sp. TaxID=538949 RepID=UPI002595E45A|nr:site-specific integrase [uncultured Alistipes sp.]
MRSTFRILFYLKRNAPLKNGRVPIMARITLDGQRVQLSTHLSVNPETWCAATGQVAGRGRCADQTNRQLADIRFRIEQCYRTLFLNGSAVTPAMIKEAYLGITHRECLLEFFRRHNEEFRRMVGVSRSATTYNKYRCVCHHLERYVRQTYRRDDLAFSELDKGFVTGFHAYIVQQCSRKKNTAWIYMIALKHVLMVARSKGCLTHDPFAGYKLHSEFVSRNYLNEAEISRMMRLELPSGALRLVRDAFVFSCFTGLSYVDVCNLTRRQIQQNGGQTWVDLTRRKTGTEVSVRLFAVPQAILRRYLPADCDEPIFGLPGNGWCNKRLEQLAAAAGISKRVTFHTARHTFATTMTLSQGVAIETISKLLGHKNIRTTQIYAVITHSTLDGEMNRLSRRIDALYPQAAVAELCE